MKYRRLEIEPYEETYEVEAIISRDRGNNPGREEQPLWSVTVDEVRVGGLTLEADRPVTLDGFSGVDADVTISSAMSGEEALVVRFPQRQAALPVEKI